MKQCPKAVDFYTLDQIAECFDGIPKPLYAKLWQLTSEAEKAKTAQPLGGDGSNGTTEIPIVGGDYDNVLGNAWSKFTDVEKYVLLKALDWNPTDEDLRQ
jgi:hypothetical protein